ncbi:MAG: hypothetical protein VKK42_05530 [Lyngbya sp.]|nr:hypothetical protein [Lyngbya sp.]
MTLHVDIVWERYIGDRNTPDRSGYNKVLYNTIGEFDLVPNIWLINGYAHRCAHCGTLISTFSPEYRTL